MTGLVVRRLLQAVPVLVVASMVVFLLLFVGPNPLEQLREDPAYTSADVARLTAQYGWDRPITEQYLRWAGGLLHGDWGTSLQFQRPALDVILDRLPLTLFVSGLALMLSVLVALPVGVFVAVRRYSRVDYATTVVTFGLMATPSFFVALLFQAAALKLKDATGTLWFATGGAPMHGSLLAWAQHLALPVIVLSALQIGSWTRYQRSELLGVLATDYVKSALAKGLPFRVVLTRHALRNTMLPIVTLLAMDLAGMVGGTMITETVFGLPGVGTLLLDAVRNHDVVLAVDIMMVGAVALVLANAAADVTYGVLDPRVREA